jgi:hypothetical protein
MDDTLAVDVFDSLHDRVNETCCIAIDGNDRNESCKDLLSERATKGSQSGMND